MITEPTVLVLGAGASLAACGNGDKNGRRLPLMRNLVEVTDLDSLLARHGASGGGDDFEALFQKISEDPKKTELVIEVKDPSRIDSNDVQRKRKAAEMWCKQRKMEYIIATVS